MIAPSFDERKVSRRPLRENVVCVFGDRGWDGKLTDISERGAFVVTDRVPPKGGQVYLDFSLPYPEMKTRLQFHLRGIITRPVDQQQAANTYFPEGFAVSFYELTAKEREALRLFCGLNQS